MILLWEGWRPRQPLSFVGPDQPKLPMKQTARPAVAPYLGEKMDLGNTPSTSEQRGWRGLQPSRVMD